MKCKVVQWEGDIDFLSAAGNGDIAAVEKLLKQGSDVNTQDEEGKTALMYAVMNSHTDVIRQLLEAGADVAIKDNGGDTASDLAGSQSNWGIFLILNGTVCPFCGEPPDPDKAYCSHYLGGGDRGNDDEFNEALNEIASEFSSLVEELDGDSFEAVLSNAPKDLTTLFELIQEYGKYYWMALEGVEVTHFESCVPLMASDNEDCFHADKEAFIKKVKKDTERSIIWLATQMG
jgi:hypothetical protein